MINALKDDSGYTTVEACLVFTTILFSIFAVMYAFMMMYQNVVVLNAATTAAQEGANMMSNIKSDWACGSIWTRFNGLFDETLVTQSNGNSYSPPSNNNSDFYSNNVSSITEIANKELSRGMISPIGTTVTVKYNGGFFLQEVYVTVEQKIPFPFRGIAERFGNSDFMMLKATSCSRVTDRKEYIRNIDLTQECIKRATSTISDYTWKIVENLLK